MIVCFHFLYGERYNTGWKQGEQHVVKIDANDGRWTLSIDNKQVRQWNEDVCNRGTLTPIYASNWHSVYNGRIRNVIYKILK